MLTHIMRKHSQVLNVIRLCVGLSDIKRLRVITVTNLIGDTRFIWLPHTTSRAVHIQNMHLYRKDRQFPPLKRSGHRRERLQGQAERKG
jgi:hypothetical protein